MAETTPLSGGQHPAPAAAIAALLDIARDLTASLAAPDRYGRLLQAIRRVIPYDAAGPPADKPSNACVEPGRPLAERVRDYQRRLVREALERNGGRWAAAARELGMHRSNLHHLARRLGLRKP